LIYFQIKNTLKCNLYHIPKTHLVLSNCTHMAGTGFVLYIKGFWYCCIKVGEDWIRYCTTTHLSLLSRSDQISFVIEGYISCFQFEWNASLGCLLEGFFFPSNWQLCFVCFKMKFQCWYFTLSDLMISIWIICGVFTWINELCIWSSIFYEMTLFFVALYLVSLVCKIGCHFPFSYQF
jgi:hypothetical protein